MGDKIAITAVCWIPKGRCRPKPVTLDAEKDDDMTGLTEDDKKTTEAFNMDDYDNEEDDGLQFFQVLKNDLHTGRDEYLTGNPDSDSDSEEYLEVRPDDQLFVAVSCEEDTCSLEVYLYDKEDCSMYVHHDIMLPAYPLCLEWFDGLPPTHENGVGNFAAVGAFNSSIDIWDLDELDPMEPMFSLGENGKAHKGAVMCLHSSPLQRTTLASGGADKVVVLWDLCRPTAPLHTFTFHTDKVQCTRWHPSEQSILLTASFDKTMAFVDVRQQEAARQISLPDDAEAASWGSSLRPAECYVSCENGNVVCYDARKLMTKKSKMKPLWTLAAHDKACTTVQQPRIQDMLVTTSLDGVAKVWSLKGGDPSLVFAKNLAAGPLFTSSANDETPNLLVLGGQSTVLWDLESEDAIVQAFGLQAAEAAGGA